MKRLIPMLSVAIAAMWALSSCVEADKTAEAACADLTIDICPEGYKLSVTASSESACEAELSSNVISGEEGASGGCSSSGSCFFTCAAGGCGDGICSENEVCVQQACADDNPDCNACKEDCCSACGDGKCVVPETGDNCNGKNYCPNDCGEGTKECIGKPPTGGGTTDGGDDSGSSSGDTDSGGTTGDPTPTECTKVGSSEECQEGEICRKIPAGTLCLEDNGGDSGSSSGDTDSGGNTGGSTPTECSKVGSSDECEEGEVCKKIPAGTFCLEKKD
jgi:hypothetical protein